MSDNLRGALLMMAAMAGFTLSDACVKLVVDEVPLFQVIFLRGLVSSIVFLLLAWRMGALRLPVRAADHRLIGWRTATEVLAAGFFLTALVNMPLANATAIMQSMPLTLTLASALFLGERVGMRRWTAVALGFVGVLLIVRPGAEGFSVYSLYALAAVVCVTGRDIATRRLSPEVPSLVVALVATLGVTVVFGVAAAVTGGWVMPSARGLALLAGTSLFVVAGYLFSVLMMRRGEVSVVAPFRYTSLIWALVLGSLLFGDWPDGLTLAGVAIIVVTGSFTLWRAGRKAPAVPVAPREP